MSPPSSPAPLDRAAACAKDAANPGSCICGNCANDAVTSTCLRYTAVQGEWQLAECRPGTHCDAVFPSGTGTRTGDTIVSCPCGSRAPPSEPPSGRTLPPSCAGCAPTAPCAPPAASHGVEATLRNVFAVLGVAATVAGIVWLLLKLLSGKDAAGDLPPLPPYGPSGDMGMGTAAGLGGAGADALGAPALGDAPTFPSSSPDGFGGMAAP